MATLYVNFKQDCEGQAADAAEKLTIGASDAVSTNASVHKQGGVIELQTDTACLVAVGPSPATSVGGFYVLPNIKAKVRVANGCKVAVKAA